MKLPQGCHRSHPHEEMSEACGILSQLAANAGEALARPWPANGHVITYYKHTASYLDTQAELFWVRYDVETDSIGCRSE